jgi:hypothetical protein
MTIFDSGLFELNWKIGEVSIFTKVDRASEDHRATPWDDQRRGAPSVVSVTSADASSPRKLESVAGGTA